MWVSSGDEENTLVEELRSILGIENGKSRNKDLGEGSLVSSTLGEAKVFLFAIFGFKMNLSSLTYWGVRGHKINLDPLNEKWSYWYDLHGMYDDQIAKVY